MNQNDLMMNIIHWDYPTRLVDPGLGVGGNGVGRHMGSIITEKQIRAGGIKQQFEG